MDSNTKQQLPYTEGSNPLSKLLDGSLNADQFLLTLRACDGQVFSGFNHEVGLMDTECIHHIEVAAKSCAKLLQSHHPAKVVMTGCGTSGRVSFLTARRYNNMLNGFGKLQNRFGYTCAGGDSAILLSDEMPEDDPVTGVADLQEAAGGNKECVLIGVTCGVSAPYVAGQVAHLLTSKQTFEPHAAHSGICLVGFNPVNMARDSAFSGLPSGWKSCRDVAVGLDRHIKEVNRSDPSFDKNHGCSIVNPVVGPEPVSGSSRMKGGTATLVILDVICLHALGLAGAFPEGHSMHRLSHCSVLELLCKYQTVHSLTYSMAQHHLPRVMDAAASALRGGNKLYYIGLGSAAVVGGIDASEMPDTYGAPFDQTRAFILGGWKDFGSVTGDLSAASKYHRIGFDHFEDDILPTIVTDDCVVILISHPESANAADLLQVATLARKIFTANVKISLVCATLAATNRETISCLKDITCLCEADRCVFVNLPEQHSGFSDLALKLMSNAISTYAQAAGRGAMYRSQMIGTGPANDKIYERCVRLISEHVSVSVSSAEVALIKSIYGINQVSDALYNEPRINHIKIGLLPSDQRHETQVILPVAFILAAHPALDVAIARTRAQKEPRIDVLLGGIFGTKGAGVGKVPYSDSISDSKANANANGDYVIGVDLGGTHIRGGAIRTRDGFFLCPVVKHTVASLNDTGKEVSSNAVLECLVNICNTLAQCVGRGPVAIGVGQPGSVDTSGSICCLANYPHWIEPVPVKTHLVLHTAELCPGAEVFVYDDADSALAGELRYGRARLAKSVAMFTLGTGIGTSVSFEGGALYKGSRGLIEGGHTVVQALPGSPTAAAQCSCGQLGCLEMYCSGASIARSAVVCGLGPVTAEEVVSLASKGDTVAENILDSAARYLSIGVLNSCRHYDVDLVLFGGGLAPELLPRVRHHFTNVHWSIHPDSSHCALEHATCAYPGVQGAAALAMNSITRDGKTRSPRPVLRPADGTGRDRTDLFNVCLVTGDAGNDATAQYSDQGLLGSIFVGPYLDLSSEFAYCLDNGEGVAVGYVLGALDTRAFNERCTKYWSALAGKYENISAYNDQEQNLIRSELLPKICSTDPSHVSVSASLPDYATIYPSHLHIDLLPSFQHLGYGSIMIETLLSKLRRHGSTGVHLVQAASNQRAYAFYCKLGFTQVATTGTGTGSSSGDDIIMAMKL